MGKLCVWDRIVGISCWYLLSLSDLVDRYDARYRGVFKIFDVCMSVSRELREIVSMRNKRERGIICSLGAMNGVADPN